MNGFGQQQLVAALILLVSALFVAANLPHAARWRRQLRAATIIGFLIALAVVLGEIALWLAGL